MLFMLLCPQSKTSYFAGNLQNIHEKNIWTQNNTLWITQNIVPYWEPNQHSAEREVACRPLKLSVNCN